MLPRPARIFSIILLVAALVGVNVWGCQAKKARILQTRNIKVGIATWAGFGIGFIAKEQGYFRGLNVDLKILDDTNARQNAFRSGELDVRVSSADVFLQERGSGLSGTIFLVTDASFGGDGIIARRGIDSLSQLRGKRIAFARATPSHFLLAIALAAHGLKLRDIKLALVEDPTTAAQALRSGRVDAAVTWEPFLTQLASEHKGKILCTSRDFPVIVDVLVGSSKFLANTAAAEVFCAGWLKAVDFAKANPDSAAAILSRGLKVPVADVSGMLSSLQLADAGRNAYYLGDATTEPAITRILHSASAVWAQDSIPTVTFVPLPSVDLFTNRYLRSDHPAASTSAPTGR